MEKDLVKQGRQILYKERFLSRQERLIQFISILKKIKQRR
ncbi:MAG: hypothetical protein C5S40_02835 [ANME-2 cluster archaeon]|nr:hypothetical protein [ANME-2 cluster archaeon]